MAQNGDAKTIIDLARETLEDLFIISDKVDAVPGQWCTLTPKDMEFLECAPSQSNKHYLQEESCEKEIKEFLQAPFEEIFTRAGHVETFWEDFSINLNHKLGLTYREAHRMDGKPYNEAKLKNDILHPIFKEVSKAACIIPNLRDETVTTHYVIEDELEMEDGKSGQKPSVDAVIQVSNTKGEILALIPIEMKVDMAPKDYSQIASYMNKLSTVKDVRNFTMVGVLIDKKQFRLAFSVFRNQAVPLPVVHISPPIAWKSGSIIHEQSMLILTCTFLMGQLKRRPYPSRHAPPHAHRATLAILKDMGKKLVDHPVVLKRPDQERLGLRPLERRIDKQIKEGKRKTDKEIEGLKKRIKLLEESSGQSSEDTEEQ